MRRREYVTAVGGSVGGFATGGVGGVRTGSLERVCPTERATAVRPGDDILFEAAATPAVEPSATDWRVDGGDSGDIAPNAPFYSYTYVTGNPAAYGRFDETGTYDVSVTVDGTTVSWTVDVTENAPAAPSTDVTSDPGPDATVTVRDDIEVTASAADDSGTLRRLFWQEGRNATYVDRTDLSGSTATVTYATTGGNAIWFIGEYPMMAWVACRDGRLSAARTEGPSVVAFRDVAITDTNAPVRAGDELVVEAEIEPEGSSTYHAFVDVETDLIVGHDPTHVDSETVEVFTGQTESVRLEFTTATVRNTQTFPVRVETAHAASEVDVTVVGTEDADEHGHLEVTGLSTNAPVTGGEWLAVTATLSNAGDEPADREVALVVGHDPTTVDTQTVLVDAGDSTTVSLGYETYPVKNDDEFPVRVKTGDDTASQTVFVHGRDGGGKQGHLEVTGLSTNAPVTGGEWLAVTATLSNAGDGPADREVALVVGHDPTTVDTQTVTVGAAETTTISLGYETYPVKNDDEFPVRVQTGDDTASQSVLVHGRDGGGDTGGQASFAVSFTGTNAPVTGGEWLSVNASIENVGDASGSHTVELVVGHSPEVVDTQRVSLDPGQTQHVSLGYETYPVKNDDTFPVVVRSPHGSVTRMVTVHGTS